MIADILFDEDTIRARVTRLGEEISAEYKGKNPLVVGVLNSSAVFLADLTRAITIHCEYDFIAVSRYTEAEGIRFEKDTSTSVEGRHVLLVEDTIDTGLTLQYVIKTLSSRKPASLEVCALLNRDNRRIAEIQPRFCGFDIPDVYVVGYGLDYEGRYRELPALYTHGSWPK